MRESLSQKPSVANNFTDKDGNSCLPPIFHVGFLSGLSLHVFLCILSQSLWGFVVVCLFACFVYLPSDVWKTVFLKLFTTSDSYKLFASFSTWIPELWGEEYNIGILVRTQYSEESYSLYIDQLWVSVLIVVYCKKNLTWLVM